jgi:hypothetical protein
VFARRENISAKAVVSRVRRSAKALAMMFTTPNHAKRSVVMAMLRKALVAAVACGSIAFAASAFAQAGGAAGGSTAGAGAGGTAGASTGSAAGTGTGGTAGAGLGGTSTTGTTTGTLGTTNSGTNSSMSSPAGTTTTNNSTALNSNTLGTSNNTGINSTLGGTAAGGTALGGNGVGSTTTNTLSGNQVGQNNLGVNAGPGVTNNLGTRGPAGSTSVSSALATTPGAGVAPNGAPSLTTPGGSTNVLGGNGVAQRRRLARAQVSNNKLAQDHATHAVHRRVANLENRHVTRIRHAGIIPGRTYAAGPGVGSRADFLGLHLGNTATPVRGVSARAMARLNVREDAVTAKLNRAELDHVMGRGPNPVG